MRVEQLIKWSCFLSTPKMGCIWEFFMHYAQQVHWHDLNGRKNWSLWTRNYECFPIGTFFGGMDCIWLVLIRTEWIGKTTPFLWNLWKLVLYLILLIFHSISRMEINHILPKYTFKTNSTIAIIISFKAILYLSFLPRKLDWLGHAQVKRSLHYCTKMISDQAQKSSWNVDHFNSLLKD